MVSHGDRRNNRISGTCDEFLKINNRSECCTSRNDGCYITNFDAVCYCDSFCLSDFDNCCSDSIAICGSKTIPTKTLQNGLST